MPTTKRLRLSIDFTVEIAETPPLLPDGIVEPPDPEYDARQARLLDVVKGNQEVLMQWMKLLVCNQMIRHSSRYWSDKLTGGDIADYVTLAPALAALPEEDQEYFRDMQGIDLFYESSDMFQASFVVTEESPVIEEQLDRTVFRSGYGKIPTHEEFA